MKVRIDKDEFWPWLIVLDANHPYGQEFRIPKPVVDKYLVAQKDFEKAHDAMIRAIERGPELVK